MNQNQAKGKEDKHQSIPTIMNYQLSNDEKWFSGVSLHGCWKGYRIQCLGGWGLVVGQRVSCQIFLVSAVLPFIKSSCVCVCVSRYVFIKVKILRLGSRSSTSSPSNFKVYHSNCVRSTIVAQLEWIIYMQFLEVSHQTHLSDSRLRPTFSGFGHPLFIGFGHHPRTLSWV